ncbi:excisionase [Ewingella americana]|uniref:excisionase n=1 Tax=Ewingella americana TaxID=41202 RepID=UPI00163A5AA4|nr:excisionase [Ewingella americana]QMV54112.1 excisionase [Ewingella americana]
MARTLTLDEWALEEFSAPVPSRATLMRYAKNGMIFPLPVKAGRCWRVEASARFIGIAEKVEISKDLDPRLMRILEDGTST